MNLYELFEDRVECGLISNQQFRAILDAAAAAEFEAAQPKRRRRGRRAPAASIEPPSDAAPDDTDALIEELPQC